VPVRGRGARRVDVLGQPRGRSSIAFRARWRCLLSVGDPAAEVSWRCVTATSVLPGLRRLGDAADERGAGSLSAVIAPEPRY